MTSETPTRPLRVMHVVDILALAGMEYGVIKTANRLDPRAVTPMICCLSRQVEITKKVIAPHVEVIDLQQDTSRNWAVITRLARLFREKKVDVVHSHNWQTYFYAVLGARLAGVPVVIHGEHGHDTQTPSWRRLQVKRLLSGLVDHFVAVSADLARELVQEWRLRPERLTPIANGVDLETFRPDIDGTAIRREFGLDPGHRVILNVGGLRRVKDHPTLIRALARLLPKRSETRLLIVGGSFFVELKEEIDRCCAELGVTNQVVFAGPRTDVSEILASCDVYVNSSTFEGMSNTILEAMAMAKPVVATAVGGNVELLIEGETGFLVPAGDDEAMAARIEQLFANPTLSASLGAAGRRRIEAHHAIGTMVAHYADLYAETYARVTLRRKAPARSFVKRAAARAILWTGGPALVRALTPRSLRILTYHRVLPLPEARRYAFQGMVLARDEFRGQIAHIARRYHPLPLGEALQRLQSGTLPERAVAVTFDDGYGDNFEYAYPILKRFDVPATFFLVTDCLDQGLRLWWDDVADWVRRLAASPISESSGLPPNLLGAAARNWRRKPASAAAAVVARLNDTPLEARLAALDELRCAAGCAPATNDRLMMSWDDAREMARAGMSFGTHSKTHLFLEELDAETAYVELSESLRRLGEELGGSGRWLAYPRGRALKEGTDLLRRAGIEAAVTTETGVNGPGANFFGLRRIDAGFARLDSGFDAAVFEAEMAVAFARFRGV